MKRNLLGQNRHLYCKTKYLILWHNDPNLLSIEKSHQNNTMCTGQILRICSTTLPKIATCHHVIDSNIPTIDVELSMKPGDHGTPNTH